MVLASAGIVFALHPRFDSPVVRAAGAATALAAFAVLRSDRYRGPLDGIAILFPCMGLGTFVAHNRWSDDRWWTGTAEFLVVTVSAWLIVGWPYSRRRRRERAE